jgi:threonine synthase
MGLPAQTQLLLATNRNDVMSEFLTSGIMQRRPAVIATVSPAIDIQVPYNVERLLFLASGGRAALVARWIRDLEAQGRMEVPLEVVRALARRLKVVSVSDDDTLAAVTAMWRKHGYVVDPHTAVGVHAALGVRGSAPVVLATAHAAKFADAMRRALGADVALPVPPAFRALLESRVSRQHVFISKALAPMLPLILKQCIRDTFARRQCRADGPCDAPAARARL